jgi:hypothetical protein
MAERLSSTRSWILVRTSRHVSSKSQLKHLPFACVLRGALRSLNFAAPFLCFPPHVASSS